MIRSRLMRGIFGVLLWWIGGMELGLSAQVFVGNAIELRGGVVVKDGKLMVGGGQDAMPVADTPEAAVTIATEVQKTRIRKRVAEEVEAWKTAGVLNGEAAARFEEDVRSVMEESFAVWAAYFASRAAELQKASGAIAPEELQAALVAAGGYLYRPPPASSLLTVPVYPDQSPKWLEALRRRVGDEQWARVQELEAARVAQLDKYVRGKVGGLRTTWISEMESAIGRLECVLELGNDRRAELEGLSTRAVEECAEQFLKGAVDRLGLLLRSEWAIVVRDQTPLSPLLAGKAPEKRTVWLEGVVRVLRPEENKKVEEMERELWREDVRLAARELVIEVDRITALSVAQRTALEPRTVALMEGLPRPVINEGVALQNNFLPNGIRVGTAGAAVREELLMAARPKMEEELQRVVDADQMKRWKAALNGNSGAGRFVNRRRMPVAEPAGDVVAKRMVTEPEEMEKALSDKLAEMAVKWRDELRGRILLRVEEAIREFHLPQEKAVRLRSAAFGVVEAVIAGQRDGAENQLRQLMQKEALESFKARVEQMLGSGGRFFERGGEVVLEKEAMWLGALDSVLTAEQLQELKAFEVQRVEYREAIASESVLQAFQGVVWLDSAQTLKMREVLGVAMREYEPDIRSTYSGDWARAVSPLFPVAGIPEEQLRKLLNARQWERWVKSPGYANIQGNWNVIQSRHEQRVKSNKK